MQQTRIADNHPDSKSKLGSDSMDRMIHRTMDSTHFSEAIYAISPCLFDMVRNRILNANIELECMILWKTNVEGKLTNNIPLSEFKSLLQDTFKTYQNQIITCSRSSRNSQNSSVNSSASSEKKQQGIQIQPLATEDRFYLFGRIRESVIKKDPTSSKNPSSSDFETIWIQKDRMEREVLIIPQLNYGFCVQCKKENPIPREEAIKMNLGTLHPLEKVRTKQRFSLWWKKKPFRTDFTVIHSAKTHEQLQLQKRDTSGSGSGRFASYQIETEFVSDPKELDRCQMTIQDFQNQYDFLSPFISPDKKRFRENLISSELLEHSLRILQPQKCTTSLSINTYPKHRYIG